MLEVIREDSSLLPEQPGVPEMQPQFETTTLEALGAAADTEALASLKEFAVPPTTTFEELADAPDAERAEQTRQFIRRPRPTATDYTMPEGDDGSGGGDD
ncbi:MAG TPA: hypothetical protein VLA92_01800 [Candidatus Saccharimonadales bacterium]|nr:hypothetical protein [Candidatus Saccharimonadales bacterium]